MKIGVMIMMATKEPSLRNTEAFKKYIIDDYIKLKESNKLQHEYKFIFYHGNNIGKTSIHKVDENISYIHTNTKDDIYSTYEKTIESFKKLDEIDNFDFIIRINISLYLNIRLLDKIVNSLDPNIVYCNAINAVFEGKYLNTLYPRGDFYIISKSMIDNVLNVSDMFYINRNNIDDYIKQFEIKSDHVDDVLLGCSLLEALGPTYYEHLKMIYYNLVLEEIQESDDISKYLNKHIIATRIKTTPKGQISGYSWDDNDYRLNDIVKFKKCQEYFSQFDYENNISINHLLVDESNCRPVTIINMVNVKVKDIKEYWKNKGTIK